MKNCQSRLKKADFDNIFKNGKGRAGNFIFLKYRKNNLNLFRVGFVVGIKISKKANIRNRIKRRLKDIVRKILADTVPKFDIIIVAKPKIIDKKYKEIKDELKFLFEESKILNEKDILKVNSVI